MVNLQSNFTLAMLDKLQELISEVQAFSANSKEKVEAFRIKFLGSKGILKDLFTEFKNVEPSQKKEFGQTLNTLKTLAETKVSELNNHLENSTQSKKVYGDLTRPGEPIELGTRHPISIVKNQIIDVFSRIGFTISEGPEIEDDWQTYRNTTLHVICRTPFLWRKTLICY